MAHLTGIQRCLEKYYSHKLIMLEKKIRTELEFVLDHEESLWKQKSRKDWLALGDRNTRYFHSQVNKRRHVNNIKSLKLADDLWCYDEEKIKHEVVSFFRKLYTTESNVTGIFPLRNSFPSFGAEMDFFLRKYLVKRFMMLCSIWCR